MNYVRFARFPKKMESIFITTVINVGAGGTVPTVASKRTEDSPGVIKIMGFRQLGSNKNVTYIIQSDE